MGEKHLVVPNGGPITEKDVPDADVVIATYWETAPWVADLPPSKGRKFYLLQDYETFKRGRAEQVSATYDLPLEKIAVSQYIAHMLEQNHGIANIPVIPNSVDTSQFFAGQRSKSDSMTIGFLYTGKPRKNVQMAIDIASQARSVIPDLRVNVFGSIAPIDRLPLPEWISYSQAPPQDRISEIYGSCDAWLFTSEHEGFGLPILEAMACGTPVLATRAGAAPQIVDGTNGSLLETNTDAFVHELLRMNAMPADDWAKMSEAALATARSYSWDVATDRLLECLSVPTHSQGSASR
ncbi:MAG: glycosyltransferase family 4 protein [Pseudomonadota bacterium]